jgi:hypothetical protein
LLELAKTHQALREKITDCLATTPVNDAGVLHIAAQHAPQVCSQLLALPITETLRQTIINGSVDTSAARDSIILHIAAHLAPQAFTQLLELAKTHQALREKITACLSEKDFHDWTLLHVIAQHAPELIDRPHHDGWTLTHLIAYCGNKRELDHYIRLMSATEHGLKILVSHLDKAVVKFSGKTFRTPKTARDFFRKAGILIPQGIDPAVFFKGYSEKPPAIIGVAFRLLSHHDSHCKTKKRDQRLLYQSHPTFSSKRDGIPLLPRMVKFFGIFPEP